LEPSGDLCLVRATRMEETLGARGSTQLWRRHLGTLRNLPCQGGQGARGGPMPREPWDNQAGSTWMTWWLHSPAEVDAVFALAQKLGVVGPWPPTRYALECP